MSDGMSTIRLWLVISRQALLQSLAANARHAEDGARAWM
jgi:hypothetical protein